APHAAFLLHPAGARPVAGRGPRVLWAGRGRRPVGLDHLSGQAAAGGHRAAGRVRLPLEQPARFVAAPLRAVAPRHPARPPAEVSDLLPRRRSRRLSPTFFPSPSPRPSGERAGERGFRLLTSYCLPLTPPT